MTHQLFARDDEHIVRTYEYDDEDVDVLAVDLGSVGQDATVDVVDGTVIVVAGDDQQEFDLPEASAAQAFIKNGVLTVEMEGVE